MIKRRLVSFDWALKRLLRSKANFAILEGFLSELLNDDIKIKEILDGESNKEDAKAKFNRVDIKVKDSQGEIILIELQYCYESDYFQRILFGTCKALCEHIDEGKVYADVKKIISISIIYFDLGHGEDYVYKGCTNFIGIHKSDELQLSERQKLVYGNVKVREIYPEYYLIKVNKFDDLAKDSLDEWVYFLKNADIKEEFKAKGLKLAKKKLDIMKLPDKERLAYEEYIDNLRFEASIIKSTFGEGKVEGKIEGKAEMAKALKKKGVDLEVISATSGLSIKSIKEL